MRCVMACMLIIFLSSCSNRSGIPKGIIPPDSMQNIMKDVVMAQEFALLYVAKDSSKHDKVKASQDLLEDIFKLHHISRSDFKKSMIFYESRPDLNKKIFDSLAAYTNRHRTELYMPKPTTPPGQKPIVSPAGIPMVMPGQSHGMFPHGQGPLMDKHGRINKPFAKPVPPIAKPANTQGKPGSKDKPLAKTVQPIAKPKKPVAQPGKPVTPIIKTDSSGAVKK